MWQLWTTSAVRMIVRMRGFLLILSFFALVGVGVGLLVMTTKAFGATEHMAEAFALGYWPLLIGVVALAGIAICLAVDEARKDIVARLERQ